MKFAKVGAVLFVLWGLLHILGGAIILMAVGESPAQGYAIYQESSTPYSELAGAVLGYLAYSFIWIAVVVTVIGIRYNWNNSEQGLMLNTALVGLTDLGLVIFLVLPGFVSYGEAAPGLLLFVAAVVFGGMGCRSAST